MLRKKVVSRKRKRKALVKELPNPSVEEDERDPLLFEDPVTEAQEEPERKKAKVEISEEMYASLSDANADLKAQIEKQQKELDELRKVQETNQRLTEENQALRSENESFKIKIKSNLTTLKQLTEEKMSTRIPQKKMHNLEKSVQRLIKERDKARERNEEYFQQVGQLEQENCELKRQLELKEVSTKIKVVNKNPQYFAAYSSAHDGIGALVAASGFFRRAKDSATVAKKTTAGKRKKRVHTKRKTDSRKPNLQPK